MHGPAADFDTRREKLYSQDRNYHYIEITKTKNLANRNSYFRQVIPTLAYILTFLSGSATGTLSDMLSGTLAGILSGILLVMLFGILYLDILSGMEAGILSDNLSGIWSNPSIWHFIWLTICHVTPIWHQICQSMWDFIWHSMWHSKHIYSDIASDIPSGILQYLTYYKIGIWHLASYQTCYFSAFYLA